MNHLDKYEFAKQAYLRKSAAPGDGGWLPDQTFETTASDGIGSDIGNFFKGVGNVFADPITGLFSGEPKKMLTGAALAGLTFLPGGRAVAGASNAGLNTVKGLTTVGKNSGMAALRQGVGWKEGLANSYKFWKPGWLKGMAHGYTKPLNLALVAGVGGLNSYTGRAMDPTMGPDGQSPMGDFNPSSLVPIALSILSLLRGRGGAGAQGGVRSFMPGAGSGLQTERMGYKAY